MRILISGAGVAGLTIAYWLKRYGFLPTVVERHHQLRSGGYKIDVRGTALQVLKRMGIYEDVKASSTDMQGATVVDRNGKVIAEMSGDAFGLRTGEDLEIVRGDLCQILQRCADDVEIIFSDAIRAISQTTDGVEVEFEKSGSRIFDLVIGADGLHSTVRRLVFGEEERYARNLGLYLCVFTVSNDLGLDRWEMEYADLGKIVNIFSTKGSCDAKAAFGFTAPHFQFDPRDIASQKELLRKEYAHIGWQVPCLLKAMDEASDFYFDAALQIVMDHWSQGRIVLLGDAGYCASPMSGQGTSLALIGAYILAGELHLASGDHTKAFARYESLLYPFVKRNQEIGIKAAHLMRTRERGGVIVWLHEQVMRLAPGRWVEFFTKRAARRISQAANSITLKEYPFSQANQ